MHTSFLNASIQLYCLRPIFVPHLTQLCPGTTYPGYHHMSVYRRVCSAPARSPPSDCAESQDAMQARTERKSE